MYTTLMQEGLFFFTGPNGYFVEKEVQKWQKSFAEKFGKENCIVFNSDTITLAALQEHFQGGGLFSQKKLLICKGVPEDKAGGGKPPAQVIAFLEERLKDDDFHVPAETLLVFVSVDPDKRLKLYKTLSEKAQVKTFADISDAQLKGFIQGLLGVNYSSQIENYLLQYVGNNLFRIEQECDKINTYIHSSGKKSITDEELANIVYSPIQVNAFGVLDAICEGKTDRALDLTDKAAKAETERPEFLGMLYRGIKHMLQTTDIYVGGIKSAKDIAAEIGMHFFPIVKNIKNIEYLLAQKRGLQMMFHRLLEIDKSIKSGWLPAEGFRTEIKIAIYTTLNKEQGI